MKHLINPNEKIFLAGANGMAGSAILRSLTKKGYGNKKNDGFIFTPSSKELDLTKINDVKKWFKINNPSVVILAAAKVGGILANQLYPKDFLLDNLKIQTNVIETASENNVKRLIFLGSSCIYPKNSKQPIKEEYLLTGELEKTNEWYAIAKIAGLKLCESLRIQNQFDVISLMPTNLYGIGDNYHPQNSHVMASLIKKFCDAIKNNDSFVECWGTGKPMREFMHADDLGEAVVFALENWDPFSENSPKDNYGRTLTHLNVGTGKEISIYDLSKKIAKATGFKGDIKWDTSMPDGTFRKRLDVTNLKSIGWEPKINLDEGLVNTIEIYRNEYLK